MDMGSTIWEELIPVVVAGAYRAELELEAFRLLYFIGVTVWHTLVCAI